VNKNHYIGYFSDEKNNDVFIGSVPAILKMRYILRVLEKSNIDINVLSLSARKTSKQKIKNICVNESYQLMYMRLFAEKNKYYKHINNILRQFKFFIYFLFRVGYKDVLFLYHTPLITKMIKVMKFIKPHVKYILEVEEVYSYSPLGVRKTLEKEQNMIELFDMFLFVNDFIPYEMGIEAERFIVSYGVNNTYEKPESFAPLFDDNLINVVYAGTIDPSKKGAFFAVDSFEYLPDKYRLHLLGFGKPNDVEDLLEKVRKINEKFGYEKIHYHGFKTGDELSDIFLSCKIGLSPNAADKDFSAHSFPSKVVTYISHGLDVVSEHSVAFEMCRFSKYWTTFKEFDALKVAESIINLDLNDTFNEKQELIARMEQELQEWFEKEFYSKEK